MSESINPFESPQALISPHHEGNKSSIPKVLGILNIVFGAIGIFSSIGGLALNKMQQDMATLPPETLKYLKSQETTNFLNSLGGIILGALLLFAGLKLIKYRRQGVKLTNIWAILRILFAFVASYFAYGAMQDMPQISGLGEVGGGLVAGGIIFGLVISCAYPIICLILLKRPNATKDLI